MNIKDLVLKAYRTKVEIEKQKALLDSFKAQLQKHFDRCADDKFSFGGIVASKRERVNITYFLDKLHSKLGRNTFKKVTKRRYYVKDVNKMVDLLKAAGIKPKQFKNLIDVEMQLNEQALKQAFETGEVTKEQLEGCYKATIVKYIDIREKKGDDE